MTSDLIYEGYSVHLELPSLLTFIYVNHFSFVYVLSSLGIVKKVGPEFQTVTVLNWSILKDFECGFFRQIPVSLLL